MNLPLKLDTFYQWKPPVTTETSSAYASDQLKNVVAFIGTLMLHKDSFHSAQHATIRLRREFANATGAYQQKNVQREMIEYLESESDRLKRYFIKGDCW